MATQATDHELLGRYAKRGDVAAFEQLVERHQGELLRLAAGFVRDTHTAQDLVQDGFISLAREAGRVLRRGGRKHDGSILAWLRTVIRHAAIDRYRKERRVIPSAVDEAEAVLRHVGADPELGELLWAAVDQLSPLQRAAVVLRYRDDLSYKAIAEALGKSVSHVGVLLHQALAVLRAGRALREEVLP